MKTIKRAIAIIVTLLLIALISYLIYTGEQVNA